MFDCGELEFDEKFIHSIGSNLIRKNFDEVFMLDSECASILEKLRDPRLTTGDVSKDQIRMFNYWKEQGIFPCDVETSKQARLSSFDLAWCHVVNELRRFGMPYDRIKKVKKCVFDSEAGYGNGLTSHEYGFLRTLMVKQEQTFLVVLVDGTADVLSMQDILETERAIAHGSFLQINLNALYMRHSQFGGSFLSVSNAVALSSKEKSVIEAVRNVKDADEVKVKMRGDVPDRIETVSQVYVDKNKTLSEYLDDPHGIVTFYSQGPGRIGAKVTKRKKV